MLYRVPGKITLNCSPFVTLDGSSYVYGTITCEEKDPPLQNLTDVNEKLKVDPLPEVEEGQEPPPKTVPNPSFGKCALADFPFTRILKLNTNGLTSIDEVAKLQYLLELQAKSNEIKAVNFLGPSRDML